PVHIPLFPTRRSSDLSLVNPGPVDTNFFDARGHAYEGDFPKPVATSRVVEAVMRAVDKDEFEQVVPRWLRQAVILRHLVPPLLRSEEHTSEHQSLAYL